MFNTTDGDYLSNKERSQLGRLQWAMLAFVRRNYYKYGTRRFSIARDADTRRVAESLERRGKIRLVRHNGACWQVSPVVPDTFSR